MTSLARLQKEIEDTQKMYKEKYPKYKIEYCGMYANERTREFLSKKGINGICLNKKLVDNVLEVDFGNFVHNVKTLFL